MVYDVREIVIEEEVLKKVSKKIADKVRKKLNKKSKPGLSQEIENSLLQLITSEITKAGKIRTVEKNK